VSAYFYSVNRTRVWSVGSRAPVGRGIPLLGRIGKLFVGQGHGYIHVADHRDVFFHRADVVKGESINDFAVGHAVTFDLFEDSVSGPRALNVTRRRGR
jgi:cold shock CspA family protein